MTFTWPDMLYALALVPLLAVIYVRVQERRRRLEKRFGSLWLANGERTSVPGWRRHLSPAFFLAGLSILLLALARPQTVVSLPRVEGTVILAFDVSNSMAADDLKPTRLEAAKAAARDFVQNQPPSVQIGVVAFSDNGFSVQPPSDDKGAILASIDRLEPTRGTSLGTGILVSLKAIDSRNAAPEARYYSNATPEATPTPTPMPPGSHSSGVIVLLTDGENTQNPDPLEAAQMAAERGVRIYTVGIGSPGGATLQIEGFSIHTQLDETLLKQIAQLTDGDYYNPGSAEELLKIYSDIESQLVVKPEKTEITALLAGAGALTLLIGGVITLFWFGRLP
jgi:Ca-activated chloride channel family protein